MGTIFPQCSGSTFRQAQSENFLSLATSIASKSSKSLFQITATIGESFSGRIDIIFSDYQHAVSVYNEFAFQNQGDCHVYLKIDVLLLANIFENFRSVCLNVYNLDPSHF